MSSYQEESIFGDIRIAGSVAIFAAMVNGFGSALLWTSQGVYISSCATDKNRGLFMGIFWFINMGSQIIGNLIAGVVLHLASLPTFFIVMACIAFIGASIFLFLGIPKNIDENPELDMLAKTKSSVGNEAVADINASIRSTIGHLVSKRVRPLLPFFFLIGVLVAYCPGLLPRLISSSVEGSHAEQDSKSAYAMVGFGVGACTSAIAVGKVVDVKGTRFSLVLGLVLCISASVLSMIHALVNTYSLLSFVTTFVWGLTITCGRTIMSSINGTEFPHKSEAFAACQLICALGSFFGFFTFSFFTEVQMIGFVSVAIGILMALSVHSAMTFQFNISKHKLLDTDDHEMK